MEPEGAAKDINAPLSRQIISPQAGPNHYDALTLLWLWGGLLDCFAWPAKVGSQRWDGVLRCLCVCVLPNAITILRCTILLSNVDLLHPVSSGGSTSLGRPWILPGNRCVQGTSPEAPWLAHHARLLRRHNVTAVSTANSDAEVYAYAENQLMRSMPRMRMTPAPDSCQRTGQKANDWLLCELTPPCLVCSQLALAWNGSSILLLPSAAAKSTVLILLSILRRGIKVSMSGIAPS